METKKTVVTAPVVEHKPFNLKKWGIITFLAVWAVLTLIFTLGSWSLIPVVADAAGVQSGWMNFALISTFIFTLLTSAFIAFIWTFMGVVGLFVAALVYMFFKDRKSRQKTEVM